MSVYKWLFSRLGDKNTAKRDALVAKIAREHGVSPLRIKADIYLNALTRGSGFVDYFRGSYYGASKEQKDTYLTTRSYYRLNEYLNDRAYISVMQNKILFCDVFRSYLGRGFINLRVATLEEFLSFTEGKRAVFAKRDGGCLGEGVSRIDLTREDDRAGLYERLRAGGQYLVEEEIAQCEELNQVNPNVVSSFRVVTLLKDGQAHVMGNDLRLNKGDSPIIGVGDGLFLSLDERGHVASNVVDEYGEVYDAHPLTGVRFDQVEIPDIAKAFELCRRAALEVPQVRYVGWDIALSVNGPVLIEGNAYPEYGLIQFNQMTGKTVGHLAEVAAVLGDEMRDIRL